MIITWLQGKMRIKGVDFTQEVNGYRCSNCNTFESLQRRVCPVCHGTYKGKITPSRDSVKVIPNEEATNE